VKVPAAEPNKANRAADFNVIRFSARSISPPVTRWIRTLELPASTITLTNCTALTPNWSG